MTGPGPRTDHRPSRRTQADRVDWRAALPITGWLPGYRRVWLSGDLVAGLTLAAYAIPVSLAYASLAGLPARAGLVCFLLGAVYALFGTSRQLSIGPTSAISLLVAHGVGVLAAGDPARYASLAALMALVVAGLCLVAWVLRLGQVVHFVSGTVLMGFKTGVALLIVVTQLPLLLGIPGRGIGFAESLGHVARHLGHADPATVATGGAAIVLLLLGERLFPRRPVAVFVIAGAIALAAWTPILHGVARVGTIPPGLPRPALPPLALSDLASVLPLSLAAFLLAYVEHASTVRTFAGVHRYPIDPDQELLALGVANLAIALGHGYPAAGGFSQSAVNDEAGARTPVAMASASVVIAALLLFATGPFHWLPRAILAAVVVVSVRSLVDVPGLRRLRRTSASEFAVSMVALLGVLGLGILEGLLVAAIFSLLALLRRAARPPVVVLGRVRGTNQFADADRHPENAGVPGALVFRVGAELVYFNAENVKQEILARLEATPGAVRLVVLDLSTSPTVDLAGAQLLGDLYDELAARGVELRLAEAHGPVRDLLRAAGVESRFGHVEQGTSVASVLEEWQAEAT
jgi:SulP family sulfate permease